MILGEAFVHVRPDESGFGEELAHKLQGALGNSGLIFGALAVAGTAAALDIGEHFEEAFFTIERRTGATGTALKGLEENFKDVFASTPGATFKNVADALSEVEIRTGLTGDALEEMTRKEIELGKITKSDVGATVESTTALMNKMGIAAKDQSSSLDILFKASQNSGKSISDLTSDMTKAVPALSGFGLSFAEQAALVSSLEKAGVRTQAVVMGLGKEFKKAADAGQDPIKVIGALVDQIKNAGSPTEQFSIAVAALGNRAGGDFVAAVNSGAFSVEELAKSLAEGKDGIDATTESTMSLGDKFSLMKNKVLVALEPISMKVLDLANVIVDHIEPAFAGLSDFVSTTFGPTFREIAGELSAFFYTLRTGFTEDEGTPIEEFALKLRDLWPQVQDAISRAWSVIQPVLESFGSFLHDNLQPILIGVGGYIVYLAGASVVGALVAALSFLVGALSSPVVAVLALGAGLAYAYQNFDGFRDVVDSTGQVLLTTFQAVASFLGPVLVNIGSSLADLATFFADRWQKIQGTVTNVLTAIKVALAVFLAPFIIAWVYFHDQIFAVVKLAWSNVVLSVQTVVRVLGDLFDFVVSILSGKWGDAWNDVEDILGAAVDLILGTLGNLGGFVVDFFSTLPGNILSALGDLAGLLLPVAADVLGGLLSGLVAAVPAVLEFFALLPFRVLGLFVMAHVLLAQVGIDILVGLWNGFQAYWPTVVQFFIDLPGKIVSFLAGAPGWLVGIGAAAVSGLWNGVVSMSGWLGTMVHNIGSWVMGGVGDLTNLLHDAAVNMIVGLWHGLESMKDWLFDKVGSLAGSIKDAFTAPLKLFSPSRVFFGYGENIGEGLALGLESTAARVTEAQRRAFAGLGSANLPDMAGAFQSPGVDLGAGPGSTAAAIGQLANAVTQLATQGAGPGGQPQALFHVEHATFGNTDVIPDIEWMMATKTSGT